MKRRSSAEKDDQGFVLISVIWIAGLLAVLATAFVLTTRSHTLIARNVSFNTKAEYIADAMARFTALQLAMQAGGGAINSNGEKKFCQWSLDATVAYSTQDQAGLIDLNVGSQELISAFLSGVTKSGTNVTNLMNALQDFRDPDAVKQSGGAEPTLYQGKYFGPKNAPFSTLSEVDQMPEFSGEMFSSIAPFVTVYSQLPGVDFSKTPEPLLKILHASGRNDPAMSKFASPTPAKVFAIDVVVQTKQKSRFFRRVVISLVLQPDRPFAVLSWERGREAGDWQFPDTPQRACLN
jgi:general secretion pathway protein K